jgi:single-strand DNA-binding protein
MEKLKMNDLNSCNFIGRLGDAPDIRYQPSGDAIASFSIAVGSQWKNKSGEKQESVEWVNCTIFGKLAEVVGDYLKKGSQVFISGRMKTDKYEKDGAIKYSTKIIVDKLQMLGSKPAGDSAEHHAGARQVTHPSAGDKKPARQANQGGVDSFDNFDDNIPF